MSSPIEKQFKTKLATMAVKAGKLGKLNQVFEGLSYDDQVLALKSVDVILRLLDQTK